MRLPGRRIAVLAGVALALLSFGGLSNNDAAAGVTDYASTLYLSSTPSGLPAAVAPSTAGVTPVVPAGPLYPSMKLVSSAGPGQPTGAITLTAGAAGTGALSTASYAYEYSVFDPISGETPVNTATAPSISGVSGKSVIVNGLPTGVTVYLYRKGTSGLYRRVASLGNNGSSSYTDTMSDTIAAGQTLLPQTQNKAVPGINPFGLGYYEFAPGATITPAGANSTTVSSPAFSGKGWLIDAPGRVAIPSGTWTFTTSLKGLGVGTAHLVIGMWKVNDSGAVIGAPIIDPAGGGENVTANISTAAGTATPIVTTFSSVAQISFAADEHLFVQFWRRQTASSTGNPTTTLNTGDGVTKIVHPAANGFPDVPTLGSVAARVKAAPLLSTTFTDPDAADTGTLSFQLCSDSTCAAPLQSGTASSLANGANATWTPTALADGTYYWRAQAQDSAGNQSGWSGTAGFTVDTVAPNVPTALAPAAAARLATSQVSATFSDVDPADSGTLYFQLCTDATCTHVAADNTTANLANGATGNWTPSVADGAYYWRVRAKDAATNQSAWSAIRAFTLDTLPPSATTLDSPADGSALSALPSLGASFVDSDATDSGTIAFQICPDAACASVIASGSSATLSNGGHGTWTPPPLADGSYFARVRNQDIAGNTSTWSATRAFSLDTTAPTVPTTSGIADGTRTSHAPTLNATFADASGRAGSVTIQVCTSSTCTSIVQSTTATGVASGATATWTPGALADRTYYWRARAQDAVGNQSAWSAPTAFVIDTVSPNVPTALLPAASARTVTPQLTATFSDVDPADSGTLSFQLCSDATCSIVVASTTSATLANGAAAGNWTPSVPDGVYYWRVRAQDAAANLSSWSTIRTLTVDTAAPSPTSLDLPADGVTVNALPSFGATFVDSDATDSGVVSFQICSDAACSSIAASGSSATLAGGGHGTWTPSLLADGTYYVRVRDEDIAGNASAWSSPTHTFSLDTVPPAVPTAGGIANATRTAQAPTFNATFANPGGNGTGTLSFQLCTNSSCTHVSQNGTASGVADGATGTWMPSPLADATYYWRVRAQDNAGNQSAWSSVSSFTIDTVSPNVPSALAPAAAARVATPQLTATFSDVDPADSGTLTFQLCSDATCASVVATHTSTTLANGAAAGNWTPSVPDGVYYWRVRAQDAAANLSAWSTIRTLTVDTAAPAAPTVDAPADGAVLSARPSVGATFVDSDATDSGILSFQICPDAACSSIAASSTSAALPSGGHETWLPSSLADGTYYVRVRSQDVAGNASAWSAALSFSLDTAPPTVPTTSGIGDGVRTPHQPTLAATFANPGGTGTGSVTIELCASSNCGSILQSATETGIADGAAGTWTPDFLSDGTYYWRARAEDNAGNRSAWSSPIAFTIDTTPPRAPTVSTSRGRFSAAPLLTADASSDTARGVIQLCADAACADVRTIGAAGRAGAGIAWQAPSLPDGTYYWRAFAEDAVGNDSGWSTTGSFVIDTVPPDVPTLGGPAAGARVSQLDLSGTFASLDTGDTGKIAFQICTDAACASPVTTWWSADTAPGVPARWSPPGLADGTYFWRLAAKDAAGNSSAWSDTRRLTLDTTPPAQPNALQATLSKQILALRWKLPTSGDQVSGYALFVNGKRTRTLQVGLLAVEIPLRAHDRRMFAIAAIDTAGNVGVRSRAVAVMPQLVNLTLQQAKAETDVRKLVLRWSKKTVPSTTRVVAQNQAAFSLVDVGSAVTVVVASEPAHRTKS